MSRRESTDDCRRFDDLPAGERTSIAVPDWSSDASKLAFAVVCDDGRFALHLRGDRVGRLEVSGLRALPIDGLDTARALRGRPDGTRVAFVAESERLRIGMSRLDGTGQLPSETRAARGGFLHLDWRRAAGLGLVRVSGA